MLPSHCTWITYHNSTINHVKKLLRQRWCAYLFSVFMRKWKEKIFHFLALLYFPGISWEYQKLLLLVIIMVRFIRCSFLISFKFLALKLIPYVPFISFLHLNSVYKWGNKGSKISKENMILWRKWNTLVLKSVGCLC